MNVKLKYLDLTGWTNRKHLSETEWDGNWTQEG